MIIDCQDDLWALRHVMEPDILYIDGLRLWFGSKSKHWVWRRWAGSSTQGPAWRPSTLCAPSSKEDVIKDLPEKSVSILKRSMSALQNKLYSSIKGYGTICIASGEESSVLKRILLVYDTILLTSLISVAKENIPMQLRQNCDYPFVFEEVEIQMQLIQVESPTSFYTEFLVNLSSCTARQVFFEEDCYMFCIADNTSFFLKGLKSFSRRQK